MSKLIHEMIPKLHKRPLYTNVKLHVLYACFSLLNYYWQLCCSKSMCMD